MDAASKAHLLRRGLTLEYMTLGWNVVGAAVVIASAVAARSVALAGFGIDSVIEILASLVVWQFKGTDQHREQRALRLISIAFLGLVIYIVLQTIQTLLAQAHAEPSPLSILWLAATLAAMLLLAWGKNRTGKALQNVVLMTEGHVTLVDAYLAAAVLVGLLLNRLLGWWWADPLAALVIVYYGLRESWHAWHEAKSQGA